MDDQLLQRQLEKTGDLLDVLQDPAVLQEIAQLEAEFGGEIGAGFPAYSHHPKPITLEQAITARRKVRLQSIVFTEFAELMQTVNLGAGAEAAIAEGRRRIRQHLANLSEAEAVYFDALVNEDQNQPVDKPIRAQLKSVLSTLLTAADWMAIGQAATETIQTQWAEFVQRSKIA